MNTSKIKVNSEEELIALARRWTTSLQGKVVVALYGELGAGKTRFAQGVAQALGVKEPVCSPTFAIAQEYCGDNGKRLVHFDLYRLSGEQAVDDFGFEELLQRADVAVIEWPERAGRLLPEGAVSVKIDFGDTETERLVRIVNFRF